MKKTRIFIRAFIILCTLSLFILGGTTVLSPRFLSEDGTAVEVKEKEKDKEKELPEYIARGVKAVSIPGIKGAIRITWRVHPNANYDFLIGRSTEVPNTGEKALRAISIKVVPAGSDPVIIDSNLVAGNYYYVVLTKDSVMDRSVELYADVNYTASPVVIEKDIVVGPVRNLPEQATLIHAREINRTQVILTWKGADMKGVIYTVYKGGSPLDTPEKLKAAEKISTIVDGREVYVDKNISRTGTYYYAVTTRDVSGNEDLQLIPDQSYTSTGIYISFKRQLTVNGLTARVMEDNSIKLGWNAGINQGTLEYLIYRHNKPITDNEILALSTFVDKVSADATSFVDRNHGSGALYYAVLIKQEDGTIDNTLVEGANCTLDSIAVGRPIVVDSLSAITGDGNVMLKWDYSGSSGDKNFQVFRAATVPRNASDLRKQKALDKVNITDKTYIDPDPPAGTFYYVLVPADYRKVKNLKLMKGVNVTGNPVVVTREGKATERKSEKKEEKPAEPASGDIDELLRATFFQGKYNLAIKRLSEIAGASENGREAAKARLFIGRSLIELKKYRKSLDYLVLPDVGKYYPQEAKFWREYAIARIKNR